MGAGKSSVGRALALRTGLPVFETDEMTSARAGLTIPQIFAQLGEEHFRRLETETLAGISDLSAKIVVTGGGIVLRAENVARLRALGRVVYLTAEDDALFARSTESDARPLLQTNDPRATFAELLTTREPLYRAAADLVIDTTHLSPEEVAEAVLAHE